MLLSDLNRLSHKLNNFKLFTLWIKLYMFCYCMYVNFRRVLLRYIGNCCPWNGSFKLSVYLYMGRFNPPPSPSELSWSRDNAHIFKTTAQNYKKKIKLCKMCYFANFWEILIHWSIFLLENKKKHFLLGEISMKSI